MRLGAGLCLLSLAAAPAAVASEVALRSVVDARQVGIEDRVELTITLEGPSFRLQEEIALPALKNLRLVGGPSVSTQISLVNGAMSQSRVYSYVLQPVAVGPAEVGPARARLADGEKTAPAIAIEVVPGSVKPRRARRPDPLDEDPFGSLFGPRRPAVEGKLFLEARATRTRLHVGEPLVLIYYLYTQVQVTDLQPTEAPQYPGFWAEDLARGKGPTQGETVRSNGDTYRRFPVIEKLLFPTRAGPLTVPPASFRVRITPQGFFGRGSVVERTTKPVEVEVRPIPGEPGFSGAVGSFRVSASLDRKELALGEAATLRFRVEGTGNLKWIDRGPDLVVPGAKVYPPQTKTDLAAEPSGLVGSRTWEYVVVPETGGEIQIPALSFSYFEPEAERIVSLASAPLTLTVAGAATAAGLPVSGARAPVARAAGGLALRAELDADGAAVPAMSGRAVTLAAAGALLLHGMILAAGRLVETRRFRRGRSADRRRVRAALRDLERASRGGMSKEAAAALVEKAIVELFGPVDEQGSPADDRDRAARRILEEVSFLRYAPQLGDYSEKIDELAARAREVVRRWA